jgi:hypothetical protein
VLQIPRATADDAGRYTCVAVNEAGQDSLQYDVRILCKFGFFVVVYHSCCHSEMSFRN